MLLYWSMISTASAQVMTSEIKVDTDYTDKTEILNELKVHGALEAVSLTTGAISATGNVNTTGKVISNGNLQTNNRVYFGGGENSSFIQHIDGFASKNGGKTTHIVNVAANGFINVQLNAGGRAGSNNVSVERNAFGYMWGTGYITERPIYSHGNISAKITFVHPWQLKIEIINDDPSNDLMVAGTITISQTGWGW